MFFWAGVLSIVGSMIFFCGLIEVKKKEANAAEIVESEEEGPRPGWRTIFSGAWNLFKNDKRIGMAYLGGFAWKAL